MIGKSQRLFILHTAISAHETSRQSAILMSGLTHKRSFALAGLSGSRLRLSWNIFIEREMGRGPLPFG
jgi:hypothetical protein